MKSIIIFLLFLIGCDYCNKIKKECIQDYDFENNISIINIKTAMQYVHDNMQYKSDQVEYWQLPEESYLLKTGDCEDYDIFFMYLLSKLNINSELIGLKFKHRNLYHSYVYIPNTDKYYSALINHALTYDELISQYKIHYRIPYCEVIWMTKTFHRGIK